MDSEWAKNRKLLNTNADKMWVEVRRAAAGCCKELNSSMGSDYIKFEGASYHNSFTLITPEATYTATFSPQTCLLSAQGTTYTLVVAEGNAVLWKDAQGNTVPSEKVAQNVVGAAFR